MPYILHNEDSLESSRSNKQLKVWHSENEEQYHPVLIE